MCGGVIGWLMRPNEGQEIESKTGVKGVLMRTGSEWDPPHTHSNLDIGSISVRLQIWGGGLGGLEAKGLFHTEAAN